MPGIARRAAKVTAIVLLSLVSAFIALNVSPIYDFAKPSPFEGPDIFNPYATLDTAVQWKKANFHTHTRVKGLLNECEYWPEQVDSAYRRFGYDIVTFSNHNELTAHPFDSTLQVNVYEHGYNIFKYHKLVFGCGKVNHFDHTLPILASQRQWQMDLLGRDAEILQLNHPYRTNFTTDRTMECLTGYGLIELDSGVGTEQEYWDRALSAGHYSFAMANDDLHYPDRSWKIARRCNMLCCSDATWPQIRECLLSGAFYCLRIPDYGDGDWTEKYRKNAELPTVRWIGLEGKTARIELSEAARKIVVTGQDHSELHCVTDSADASYTFTGNDPYARFTAYFDDGVVIYTNAFARYDSAVSATPFATAPHRVNILLTILYNLLVLALASGCLLLAHLIIRSRR